MVSVRRFFKVFGFVMIGLIISVIVYLLYSQGIVFDELITGTITIEEVMAVIITIMGIFGVIFSA
jgi:hypothetical protein